MYKYAEDYALNYNLDYFSNYLTIYQIVFGCFMALVTAMTIYYVIFIYQKIKKQLYEITNTLIILPFEDLNPIQKKNVEIFLTN